MSNHEYYLKNKEKIKARAREYKKKHYEDYLKKGRLYWKNNREKLLRKQREFYKLNKEKISLRNKIWKKNNPEWKKKNDALWIKKNPIKNRLIKVLYSIKHRCNNFNDPFYKHYGARGIKNFLTLKDLLFLWERDKAINIKNPCIDRIDNDGNYELENCHFISRQENSLKQWKHSREKLLNSFHKAIERSDWGKMKRSGG